MFHQLLTPVADSLPLSFIVAALPVLTVLVLLGVLRRPAWQSSLAGLVVGFVIAIAVWSLPASLALNSIANGVVFALWPVMWIVVNALLLYNIAVESKRFDAFRAWILNHLPNDRRVVLVVIGFCFGALAGGHRGFRHAGRDHVVAAHFGGLSRARSARVRADFQYRAGRLRRARRAGDGARRGDGIARSACLASMVGRQLPFIALILPFYVMALYGGVRSLRALWPVLLVAGGSFALCQFVTSNFINYALTDVLSSLGSLIVTLLFLQAWKPKPDAEFAVRREVDLTHARSHVGALAGLASLAHRDRSRDPVDDIQHRGERANGDPMAGTRQGDRDHPLQRQALRRGMDVRAARHRHRDTSLGHCDGGRRGIGRRGLSALRSKDHRASMDRDSDRLPHHRLAYLMNYSGMAYTLGLGASSVGHAFVFVSPFLGWLAVSLSGSDTSGNALFGNLQVVAAKQLNLDPVLFAATNSSGGVMGKMISPQNIATGVSVTDLRGHEGVVFARTFWHSIVLTLALGVLVALQQYVFPGIIPH